MNHPLAALAVVWALAVILPGPNFLAVTYAAAVGGRRRALLTALGCLVGTAFWLSAGLLGLKVLFVLLPWSGMAIKIAGGAYLVWTGIQMMRGVGSAVTGAAAGWSAFRVGLATTLANPKSAAVAASLLAVALPGADGWLVAEAFALLLVISSSWYLLVAVAASTDRVTARLMAWRLWIGRLAGGLFVLFGAKLAFER